MKARLTVLFLIISTIVFAQSKEEKNLQKLSMKIFRWEVESKLDSLGSSLDEKMIVLNSSGFTQTKTEYLARLRSGTFAHNDIQIEENKAVISGNTGIVTGKGIFDVSVNGKQSEIHLTYMEVFVRLSSRAAWRLLALHASAIPD